MGLRDMLPGNAKDFKDNIDKRLELFIIEKKDDNRLRHLNSPQKI